MGARANSSSSADDVFSEASDSNALRLVYGSDGNNPESLGESGPRPQQYEPRRVHRNDPHEDRTEHVDSVDGRLGNSDWYLIYRVIYLHLA